MAWALILATLLGSSLIRQLHAYIPEWTPLPWPVRSPLYALLVVFFLILLASWNQDRIPRQKAITHRIRLGALAPLLIALVYEKVLSFTLYDALLDHAVNFDFIRDHVNVWIHILIGLGMMVAVLLLLPLMNRVGFSNFLTAAQVRSGFYLQFFALALTFAILAGLVATIYSGSGGKPILLFPVGMASIMLLIGQGLRAIAEEFYYRGLLQRELTGLMSRLGIRNHRSGQAVAVSLVALGFGIEHYQFGSPMSESYQGFAYALAVGFLFGYILILTGNIFFCGLVHATNNFVTSDVLPRLGTTDGSVLVPGETVLYLYLVTVFLLVFIAHGLRRGTLRNTLLPDQGPVAKTS